MISALLVRDKKMGKVGLPDLLSEDDQDEGSVWVFLDWISEAVV